ncbi:MAG: NADP-dependent isocitrate dehydrogenase [Melioribacteraceae bacterium]|nr:NADP-dependent isocitrate dehydrogenase [Melioribacteraceae bacterium]
MRLFHRLELAAEKTGNKKATILAKTLNEAVGQYLENEKLPSRKVNEIDNRGCSFYLTLYWAEALAGQDEDGELKDRFGKIAKELRENEEKINKELIAAQGEPAQIDGYYYPDPELCYKEMRPSETFNKIINSL